MEAEGIIKTIRDALGLDSANIDFKTEIEMHILAALSILNQNGIGLDDFILTQDSTWNNFKNPLQVKGNRYFHLVPIYVMTKTKILFDPPPPSNVPFYDNYTKELLWRLKIGYEEDSYE